MDPTGTPSLPIIPLTGDCAVPETLDPWPVGAFDPATLRPAIEARCARLLSAEFAKGPLSDVLSLLAGPLASGAAADYVIGLMTKALQDWHLDAPTRGAGR